MKAYSQDLPAFYQSGSFLDFATNTFLVECRKEGPLCKNSLNHPLFVLLIFAFQRLEASKH